MSGPFTDAERDLVERLRAEDPEAFANLYDLYAGLLFRIGYSLLGDTFEAEDLVHDVFLGLPRALTTFEGKGSFEGWLKRVATRTGLMKLRVARLRSGSVQRRGWTLRSFERPPDLDTAMDLEAALDRVKPALRAAFVLREVQGYSYEEVADLLGISVSGAKVRVMRARRALSALLEGY